MDKLIQRHLFKKTIFEIRDNCLHFQSKGLANSIEYDVFFEEISDKVVYETKMEDLPKVALVFFVISLIIGISNSDTETISVAGFLLLMIVWIMFATRKKTASIMLYDSRMLILNLKKPDQEEVKCFIDNLKTKIKDYLKKKYGTVDRDLPLEPQLNNYIWLKDRCIINESEFNELKKKLFKSEKDKKIGFN